MLTIIKLSYRNIIDASSQNQFEKNVFNFSYEEFLLKSQAYNIDGKFKTFSELKTNDGRANSLHYKSGFAVAGFIETLNKKIPFLEDSSGKPVSFDICNFEIIETDITNRLFHIVALHFFTAALILKGSFGDFLVLAEEKNEALNPNEVFTLQLQPDISVVSYEERN